MTDDFGEYTTRLMDLPPSIRGFCYHDDDGRPVIILNSRLTREMNRRSYAHELRHIRRGEMDDPDYIEYKEGPPWPKSGIPT